MTGRVSSIDYAHIPGAILADGPVLIPLYAVTSLSLTESFRLPPVGSGGGRQAMSTHDDTISLTGLLVGAERFFFKLLLETIAESAMRGSVLAKASGGAAGGLILMTAMTIRTDIYVQSLTFSANAQRRQVLDVTMSLAHLPRPGGLAKLLDFAAVAVAALGDPFGSAG